MHRDSVRPPASLTVSSLNLHWGGWSPDGTRRYDLAAASRAMPGTVRVFQEWWDHPEEPSPLWIPDGWTVLVHEFGQKERPARFALSDEERRRVGTVGLVLATAHPVLDHHVVRLPPYGGRGDWGAHVARLDTPLGELTVVGVHLVSDAIPIGPGRQLRELVRHLPAGPLVQAGDHNLWRWIVHPMLPPGFRGAVRAPTWKAPRARHQIDHIWGRDVTPHVGRVLPDAGSDHLPVAASFT